MKAILLIITFLLIVLSPVLFAQDTYKDLTPTESQMTYETPSGGPQHYSQTLPKDKMDKIQRLSEQLDAARNSENIQSAQLIQKQLDELTGVSIPYYSNQGPQAICKIVNEEIPLNDANFGVLIGGGFWSTATCTDKVTGRMYVLGTSYIASGTDTLYVLTSLNGINWTILIKIYYASPGVHYRSDELSCTAINDGAGNGFLYYAAGFTYNSNVFATVGRAKSDGTMYFSGYPYTTTSTNRFYYPRIVSDNIRYSTNAYIYYVMSHDSLTGSLKTIKVKFGKIINPYAVTPTYTSYSTGPYFGWYYSSVADSTIAYNDITYTDSAGYNRLISVTNFYHAGIYTNLYLAYSNDLGSSNPTYIPQITETHINYIPRIAFDQLGGMTGIISYTRLFGGGDWDAYMQYTSNNGSSWASTYVDGTLDTTFASDIVAVKGAVGTFKAAISNRFGVSGGKTYARSIYISPNRALNTPAAFQVNPFSSTPSYATSRAGYHYGSADSCFTVWSGAPGGTSLYYTLGCSGIFTGISNQGSVPKVYSLEQNYPNPFNPTTSIKYSIPKSGLVKLTIYDVLGKEVTTLVNEVKTEGNYIVDFNASALSSGIYFYKITAGDFTSIKKMMLIK